MVEDTTTYDFSGVYHFGDSEMESDFILIKAGDNYYAQIKSGSFNDDATNWVWNYENLKNISVEGKHFFSSKTNGEFIVENGKIEGLKVNQSWSALAEEDGSETGYFSNPLDDVFFGNYTQASIEKLTTDQLKDLSKNKLIIMRNEIFARYGFIFKEGGEMDSYFKKQKWYKGEHHNVDKFLTSLEKENIQLIKKMEENVVHQTSNFTIEKLPKKWFRLDPETKNSEEYVINDWCEAEIEQLLVEQDKEGNWVVTVLYGQDSDQFKLIDFMAEEKEMELYQVVEGNFVVEKPTYDG